MPVPKMPPMAKPQPPQLPGTDVVMGNTEEPATVPETKTAPEKPVQEVRVKAPPADVQSSAVPEHGPVPRVLAVLPKHSPHFGDLCPDGTVKSLLLKNLEQKQLAQERAAVDLFRKERMLEIQRQ